MSISSLCTVNGSILDSWTSCSRMRRKTKQRFRRIVILGLLAIILVTISLPTLFRKPPTSRWDLGGRLLKAFGLYRFVYDDEDETRVHVFTGTFDPDILADIGNNTVKPLTEEEKTKYLALPSDMKVTERVAIVTLLRNAEDHLPVFVETLRMLSYPRNLTSIYFVEDGSLDKTPAMARQFADEFVQTDGFKQAMYIKARSIGGVFGDRRVVKAKANQLERRGHIAQVRNGLITTVPSDVDWVLWMDVDVTRLPPDLIQQFVYVGQDVMVPSCLNEGDGLNIVADLNSYRETKRSKQMLSELSINQLMLQGYGPTFRKLLPRLRNEGRVVALDGVGGCALMIKASYHRNGLHFPETPYKNHIDTEGLAKLAIDKEVGAYGLPFVEVFI